MTRFKNNPVRRTTPKMAESTRYRRHRNPGHSFTFYPFQAGTPYYFEKLPGTGGKEEHAVQEVKPIQDDCLECESKDCAYNRDGICRFSKVFDRGPSITEEDGCTEFVIRHTY